MQAGDALSNTERGPGAVPQARCAFPKGTGLEPSPAQLSQTREALGQQRGGLLHAQCAVAQVSLPVQGAEALVQACHVRYVPPTHFSLNNYAAGTVLSCFR